MNDDIVRKFKNSLDNALISAKQVRFEDDRRKMMSTVGQDIARMLTPFLNEVSASSKINKENLRDVVRELQHEISSREMNIDTSPIIEAIEKSMGNLYIPEPKVTVNVPPLKIPDIKMPEEMNVRGWVQLMGVDLNNPLPVQLRDAKGNPINLFENLTQIVNGGGGGGKHDFFTIKGFSQSAFSEITNPDGRVKVELPTGSSGLTDTELRATAVPVAQVSGAMWSTNVTNTVAVSATDLDVRDLANATDSVSVYQVSGANWSTNVTNTVTVTGSLTSTVVVGPTVADAADDGNAPVQFGGIARTANPTAVAANDVVKATFDDLGRQVVRTHQVRDLIATAYVSVTNGTETTLLAATAGAYLDCIAIMLSNNSTAALSVDIRPVTGGNIVHTIRIPADGTAGWAPPIPWPASDTGNNWTVDLPDITGTTVTASGLFSKEI